MKRPWIYLMLLILAVSCKKEQLDDCFSSTGEDQTIERPLSAFTKLNVGDKFIVKLKQDQGGERIRITGGENILEGISTEVENGELIIKNCNTCNFVRNFNRQVVIELFVTDLQEIFVYGACSILSEDTIRSSNLRIDHSALEDMSLVLDVANELYIESINSGGMTLKGRSKIFKASIEEITDIDARNLVCEEVLVDSHTPLDCYVNATRLLFVKIYNQGNIYYVSEPSDLKEVNERKGSGQLLKLP